jgi:hypothetical protein
MGWQRRVEAGRGSRVGKILAPAIARPMSICGALRLEIFRIYHFNLADHERVTLQDSSVRRANKIGLRFQNGYYEFTRTRLLPTHSGLNDFSSVPEGDSSNPPVTDGPALRVRSKFLGSLVKPFRFFSVTYCRNKKLHRTPFAHPDAAGALYVLQNGALTLFLPNPYRAGAIRSIAVRVMNNTRLS